MSILENHQILPTQVSWIYTVKKNIQVGTSIGYWVWKNLIGDLEREGEQKTISCNSVFEC